MNKETPNTFEEKKTTFKKFLASNIVWVIQFFMVTLILSYVWNSKNFLSFFTRPEISFWEFLCIMAILDSLFHFFVSSFKARK